MYTSLPSSSNAGRQHLDCPHGQLLQVGEMQEPTEMYLFVFVDLLKQPSLHSLMITLLKRLSLREGFKKKKCEKVWSFAKPPSDPPTPHRFGHFSDEKIDRHFFFLEIRPFLCETNFTLGPISKSIFFCFYNGFYNCLLSPQDLGRSGYFQSCPNSCRYEIGTPDQV